MKKRKIFGLFLAMAMVATSFSITGCKGPGSNSGVQVGIVLPSKDESRWLQDEKNFKKKLDEAGFSSEVLFSQTDSGKEKENVETLINKGIKVLILAPVDCKAASSTADAAQKAGIKVISYDRLITNTDSVDYVSSFNNTAVGEMQGKYIVEHAPEGKKDVPLYLFAGNQTDNNAFDFFKGAWKTLQPKIKDGTFKIANADKAKKFTDKQDLERNDIATIIAEIDTQWNASQATKLAEDQLTKASGDMKGDVCVLAPNDDTSRAITKVFKADSSIKNLIITGQDAEAASIKSIANGEQSMTVFKDTRKLVENTINMAKAILEDKTPETNDEWDNQKKKVPANVAEIVSVDKSNYREAIIDSGYYSEDDIK